MSTFELPQHIIDQMEAYEKRDWRPDTDRVMAGIGLFREGHHPGVPVPPAGYGGDLVPESWTYHEPGDLDRIRTGTSRPARLLARVRADGKSQPHIMVKRGHWTIATFAPGEEEPGPGLEWAAAEALRVYREAL